MPLSPSSMASTTHFYPNYTFTNDFSEFPTQGLMASSFNGNRVVMDNNNNNNNTMWGSSHQDSTFIIPNDVFDNNNGALDHVLSHDFDNMGSSCWVPSFPDFQQLGGFSELANNNTIIPDCKMGFYGGNNAITELQSLESRYQQQPHFGEFVEEYCGGFVEDIKPPSYPNSVNENWGFQGNQMATVEEPNIKVGRYSEEERKERILRYLKKRNQRNFNKTIKYACRKTLADRRVRVRGRFARNNELCEEDVETKRQNHDQKEDFYGGDTFQFQIKNDDEDWLQEAMASLVYLSHSSPEDV